MGQRDKNGLLEMTLLSIPHKDRIVLFHFKLVIGKPLHDGEGSDGDLKDEFTLSIHTKQFSDIAAVTGRVLKNLKKNAIHFPAF